MATARTVTITTPDSAMPAAAAAQAGVLQLTENFPRNIWVRIYGGAPQFSPDGENWSFSSLQWTCSPQSAKLEDRYSLLITFQLVIGPGEFEYPVLRPSNSNPTLFFSPVIGPVGTSGRPVQICGVPWVEAQTTFRFSVSDMDPEFPVTPG